MVAAFAESLVIPALLGSYIAQRPHKVKEQQACQADEDDEDGVKYVHQPRLGIAAQHGGGPSVEGK